MKNIFFALLLLFSIKLFSEEDVASKPLLLKQIVVSESEELVSSQDPVVINKSLDEPIPVICLSKKLSSQTSKNLSSNALFFPNALPAA